MVSDAVYVEDRSIKTMKSLLPLILIVFSLPVHAAAVSDLFPTSDDEDCLVCHRYEKLGRVTKDGQRKYYYIQPEKFFLTSHRAVSCRDCHTEINEIPHEEVVEGVNCATECHITNPATGEWFSHKHINDVYLASAHGREKLASGDDEFKPYCISCHLNPVFNPHEEDLPKDILTTCVECHEKGEFAEKWYLHTTMRINRSKTNPLVIIEICGTCHGDPLYMADRDISDRSRHSYESYRDSFHGKFAQLAWVNGNGHEEETLLSTIQNFLWEQPAHCLNCHADPEDPEKGVHDVRDVEDPQSTIHPDNLRKTCQKCHEDTSQAFAMIGEVHNFPADYSLVEFIIYEGFFWLVASVFFILTLRITLDHNRKIFDRWSGPSHVVTDASKDLQEGL